jgi:predicted lipid-binding transport protein (Tim44 family)
LDTTGLSSEIEEASAVPLPTPEESPAGEEKKPARGSRWRGLTGSLAAGLVVLALVVLGAGVLGLVTGAPGPGLFLLLGHVVAAILALLAQRVADRKRGFAAGAGIVAVLVITAVSLWLLWLT